jgi:hypothetical protein
MPSRPHVARTLIGVTKMHSIRLFFLAIMAINTGMFLPPVSHANDLSFGGGSPGKAMYYTNSEENIFEKYIGMPNTSYFFEHDDSNGNVRYVVGTDCDACIAITKKFSGVGGTAVTITLYGHP